MLNALLSLPAVAGEVLRSLDVSPFSSQVKTRPHFSPHRVFLAIRSMSAIGIICHWSLAPPAATRSPWWIIIAGIVLSH